MATKRKTDVKPKARSYLAKDNMALAFKIAMKLTKNKNVDVEDSDILSDAYLGLVKSERNFKPSKGYAFSTFAWRVIYNQIFSGMKKQKKFSREIHNEENFNNTIDFQNKNDIINFIEQENNQFLISQVMSFKPKNKIQEISFDMMQLYYLKGQTLVQVGSKYNVSKTTAKKLIAECIENLKIYFDQSGITKQVI